VWLAVVNVEVMCEVKVVPQGFVYVVFAEEAMRCVVQILIQNKRY